jgi:hypothetical protein
MLVRMRCQYVRDARDHNDIHQVIEKFEPADFPLFCMIR